MGRQNGKTNNSKKPPKNKNQKKQNNNKKDHIYETISKAKDGKAKWRWTSWKLLLLKLIS